MKMNYIATAIALAAISLAGSAEASTIYGIYGAGSTEHLISFDSASPATLTENVALSGLTVINPSNGTLDTVHNIAFQPSTGLLYGLGYSNLYTINPTTGAATVVGGTLSPTIGFSQVGFGFDPVTGLIHIAGGSNEVDLIMNPTTGAITQSTPLAFAAGDTNAGKTPGVVGAAFSNNFSGATSTTMYDLNVSNEAATLTTENENTGALSTVGAGGGGSLNSVPAGFTISSTGAAYVALAPFFNAGDTSLFSVNLATGALTDIDTIGGVNNFLNVGSIAIPVSIVPEPASLAMAGLAIVGMVTRRRRRAHAM